MTKEEVLKILKELKAKKSAGLDGISSELLKLGAEALALPLTHIINTSIATGQFPTQWKKGKITPLYKKGSRTKKENYRPVALLSCAGMILERCIAIQIEEYMEKNNFLSEFQFGFRKGKSCVSEMLTLMDGLRLEGTAPFSHPKPKKKPRNPYKNR